MTGEPTIQDWADEVLRAANRRRPSGAELTIEQAMQALTATTVDGLTIDPLYTGDMPSAPSGEPTAAPWVVEQLHEDPDVARTAAAVRDDFAGGASGVWLRVDQDAIAPSDLSAILAAAPPDAVDVAVSSVTQQDAAARALIDWLTASPRGVAGSLGIDPLGSSAVTGEMANLSSLGEWVAKAQPLGRVRALAVDVTAYDDAGAGDVGQLAYAVATGIEYVRALDAQGVGAERAFGQILFRVAATADQFATICRLRALRRLWWRVGEQLGVPEAVRAAVSHAVTSWRIISRRDPWVNLLRATVASFASAVGGAEKITSLPHDVAWGLPNAFSRRLARNIQLLAAEEAHIGSVADAAGGAWYVEALTDQMAAVAWDVVRQIEAAGGMSKALADGLVADQIAAVAKKRAALIETGQMALTGVTAYPDPDEAPLIDVIPRPPRPAYRGLPRRRDAAPFETGDWAEAGL